MICYSDSIIGVTPDMLRGFFQGWKKPRTPEEHLEILKNSGHGVLAIDTDSGQVVGFVTALTDHVQAAFIPLLEVLPEYRHRGIGTELVSRMLDKLKGIPCLDLTCDPKMQKFYAKFRMVPSVGMVVRAYLQQETRPEGHLGGSGPTGDILARPVEEADRPWITKLLTKHWGSARIVTRGRVHHADQLPGFVAILDGERAGLITYCIERPACEIVSLNSLQERQGIGTLLIQVVHDVAVRQGCTRLWLITTNDNTAALRFYQRRGFVLAAIHRDAVAQSRKLKPEIPMTGTDGIPLRDEIELEMALSSGKGQQPPMDQPGELAGQRIVLRPVTLDDAEHIARWKSDPFLKRMALDPDTAISVEGQKDDIRLALASSDQVYWLLLFKETRQPVGYIRFVWMDRAHRCAWLRFALGERRGEGLAREGLACALSDLFRQGGRRVEAEVFAFNDRSLALLHGLGFKEEGIKRQAHFDGASLVHVVVLGLLSGDWLA